jgi:transcription termination factor Rho
MNESHTAPSSQHQNNHGGGRNRRRRRRGGGSSGGGGGGGGGGGHSYHSFQFPIGALPTDEQIEADAQALAAEIAEKKKPSKKSELDAAALQRLDCEDLAKEAKKVGLEDVNGLPAHTLVFEILRARAKEQGLTMAEGSLEIATEGYGFLRSSEYSYLPTEEDVFVSAATIRSLGLRRGQSIRGIVRAPKEQEMFFALLRVDAVNGLPPEQAKSIPLFENLTPLHPDKRIHLEMLNQPTRVEPRIIDMVTPLGFGQRALIVAPPRTGKTVILQQIANAVATNHPDVSTIVLLIDERPEEVTDFKRNTPARVEVVASTFDEEASRHIQVAEMVIEKAKRMVECGQHVVILLDSITRLARGYNNAMPNSGKIGSGGVDNSALIKPKKFFGAARNIENGGSLTIIATALVDTGSRADEVIFEEFKGTGNAELHLDRKLVEKRTFPAINVSASGTRREELLLDPRELDLIVRLRKVVSDMNVVEAMELLRNRVIKTRSNAEFLMTLSMG